MSSLRTFLFLGLIGGASWFGYATYRYLFDTSTPTIVVEGLQEGCAYAGDVSCTVTAEDEYYLGDISLWLDDKPLVKHHTLQGRQCDHNLTIPTKTLPQGLHTLKVCVRDSARGKNTTTLERSFVVDNTPLQAALINVDTPLRVFQGRTLHLQFQVNKPIKDASVTALSKTFPCCKESPRSLVYECFIPIHAEELPSEHMLTIDITDAVGTTVTIEQKFQIVAFPFKTQTLGVNPEKFKKEAELGRPEADLEGILEDLTTASHPEKLWHGNFYVPCDQKGISTEYGVLRTTVERGKYRHNAVDLIAPPKSSVWACQDGRVVLKDRFEHSGNTIVLDHGCGVLSLYFHLDEFAPINEGDIVRKGKPVGKLGMTGYASGYHLHWELRVGNVAVDPMQWTRLDF